MDKKSIIGLIVIGVILFGFTWYNSNQLAEYNKQKAVADSIAAINAKNNPIPQVDTLKIEDQIAEQDTITTQISADQPLYEALQGENKFYTVETNLANITLYTKGGKVAAVNLKDYKTYKGAPLMLFDEKSSKFDLSLFIKHGYNTAQINTSNYNFKLVGGENALKFAENEDKKEVVMRLEVDSVSHIDYVYTFQKDNYMVDFDIRFINMASVIAPNQGDLELVWENVGRQNEKGFDNENNYTTIAYNYPGEKGIEELGISKESKEEEISTKIKWVAFKQQFFSSIIIAKDNFQNGEVKYTTFPPSDDNIKQFYAKLAVPFSAQTDSYSFQFYFGPNKYTTLKKYDLNFDRLIPLGGWIIGWVNRWLVIPTFDILGKHIANYGIIILLLTIIIKIIIAPLTYKSYLSSAKMRLLKPDVDKISEKYPKPEDAMKKQQAVMGLYKSAGVNPMGGCIPMLIQFPILIAMFKFFPASIELRGEHFLWADDLSSYDSIFNLPFDIPFYGSHVSLFTLLMAVSVYISSKISYNQTAAAGPQMAGMKFMMLYMMPVMLLLWFNNYSSGLSYYYLISNIFTIGQTYAFRYAINDEKLHQKLKENTKKPVKKSKWQTRYEEMMKQQQTQAKKK